MRTTLNIDDDLLEMAKERAKAQRRSTGEVVSSLMRSGLEKKRTPWRMVDGVPVFHSVPGAKPMTIDAINELRDVQ
ncbi:MAG: CopG family transcriptional regulator [Opitutales bacterium]